MALQARPWRDFFRQSAPNDKEVGLEVSMKDEFPGYSLTPNGQRFRTGTIPTTVGLTTSNNQQRLGVLLANIIGKEKVFNPLLCVAGLIETANAKSKRVRLLLNVFAT